MTNSMGPNVLWLADSLSEVVELRPGMNVLDLGCGKAVSSIFFAREFGVRVWATDLWIPASENWQRVVEAGCEASVYPIHAEAHALPFAEGFFDALVSVDAYHYFGTDDLYLGYLALRRTGSTAEERGKRCAIAGLIAFADVPIVHMSVTWWQTLHQNGTVFNPNLDVTIHGSMAFTLVWSVGAFTLFYVYLMLRRLQLAEKIGFPSWVEVDVKKLTGTFKGAPDRSEFGQDINESLVVELYSK